MLCKLLPRAKPPILRDSITKNLFRNSIRNMNTSTTTTKTYNVSPFSSAVVSSMRRLYPEYLADKSFDNTGFLVQAPFLSTRPRNRNSVLLTVDLTRAVADEAIENGHSVVVAYHPIIFRGLKSITTDDTQQLSMTLLLAHGVSVYCPHTAVDTVPDGMADWLCDIVTGKTETPEDHAHTATYSSSLPSETEVTTTDDENGNGDDTDASANSHPSTKPTSPSAADHDDPFASTETPKPNKKKLRLFRPHSHRTYSKPTYPRPTSDFQPSVLSHTRSVITPSPRGALDEANRFVASDTDIYHPNNTGAGRLIEFAEPQPLTVLITRIAHAIGLPKGFAVAVPQGKNLEEIDIASVATCPGSGGSVVRGCRADLVFTGELSHHEALAVTERGGCVISLFHTNSERGYLWTVMREKLENEVREEWARVRNEEGAKSGLDGEVKDMLQDESVEVVVSERDRDPYGIVVLEETAVEGIRIGSGSSG